MKTKNKKTNSKVIHIIEATVRKVVRQELRNLLVEIVGEQKAPIKQQTRPITNKPSVPSSLQHLMENTTIDSNFDDGIDEIMASEYSDTDEIPSLSFSSMDIAPTQMSTGRVPLIDTPDEVPAEIVQQIDYSSFMDSYLKGKR